MHMKDNLLPVPQPVNGIRTGIGGWTYAPWRDGMFYPPKWVQRRELEYASRQLTTIEINGTYYGTQKPAIYAKWREQTPDTFLFSAKAPGRIMQARDLTKVGPQIEDFVGGIAELDDRLGPLVWQFDKGIQLDLDRLTRFVELLPTHTGSQRLRHVLDVRDASAINADFIALCRANRIATVLSDSNEYPSFADLSADFVYARLMRSRADVITGYANAELEHWAQRARIWAHGGEPNDLTRISSEPAPRRQRRDVFIYFISAAKERNPAAAMALHQLL